MYTLNSGGTNVYYVYTLFCYFCFAFNFGQMLKIMEITFSDIA